MSPSLDIIIVNWNTGRQLYDCLESITTTHREGIDLQRVVVIDNASVDGSADHLDNLDLPLVVIRNTTNRGFATACNQGASTSRADYLLFLNPDTRLCSNSLAAPVYYMEQSEQSGVGICGIQLVDEHGNVNRTCARFPHPRNFLTKITGLSLLFPNTFHSSFMLDWNHMNSRYVNQVMGAFFLTRRSLFESMKGFDERFFVYYEELDFSIRAYKDGWLTYYLTNAQVYHKGHGSSEQVRATALFYSLLSRIQYCYKHFNWLSATMVAVATLLLEPITRIGFALLRSNRRDVIKQTIQCYLKLWRSIPSMLRNETRCFVEREQSK